MKRRSSTLSKSLIRRIIDEAKLADAPSVQFNFPTGENVIIDLQEEQNKKIKLDSNFTI